jgi:hypothetical protein
MAPSLGTRRRHSLHLREPEAQLALFPQQVGEAEFERDAFVLHRL